MSQSGGPMDQGRRTRVFFAPGRINLIGEHTDYTGGLVMPAAIDAGTTATVSAREDASLAFASRDYPGEIVFRGDVLASGRIEIIRRSDDGWGQYVLGVLTAWVEALSAMGRKIPALSGLSINIESTLPQGAGLSSSASLTVLIAYLLDALGRTELPRSALVRIAKMAENDHVGVASGIMDPFAIAFGREGHAIFLHTDTLDHTYVPLAFHPYELIVIDSGKRRTLVDSAYNTRFGEAERAWREIRRIRPELPYLGALTPQRWSKIRPMIKDPVLVRRVDHLVGENERVREARRALEKGDLPTFASLLTASHRSLRDLYEVTGPELDALVDTALSFPGVLGARMMGAGFGGVTLNVVEPSKRDAFVAFVRERYTRLTGLLPRFYRFQIADGVREIRLPGTPAR